MFSNYAFQFHDQWPLYGCYLYKYGFMQDWSTAYMATGLLMPLNAILSVFLGAAIVCGILQGLIRDTSIIPMYLMRIYEDVRLVAKRSSQNISPNALKHWSLGTILWV